MGQRLGQLGRILWNLLRGLWRGIAWVVGGACRALSRWVRALGVEREIRAEERRRREVFENLGKMVYLLYKRSLIRNADLLAECEKVVQSEARIDEMVARVDAIRAERPTRGQPPIEVASVPAEMPGTTAPETIGADAGAV